MLAPDVRALLLDSLRPPVGMTLDYAVATTYTLDLTSALTVPLALAGFALGSSPDPISVMESIRRTADRLDVFCQSGLIAPGMTPSDLVPLLEESLHEVRAPREGFLFHPKLWVLRFVGDDGDLAYRCLVSSRNLTADRSWDVILRLDSASSGGAAKAENREMGWLVGQLPDMCVHGLPRKRVERVAELADELRRVTWAAPDGLGEPEFLAFGLQGRRSARPEEIFAGYRHLIVSPFVTAGFLNRVQQASPKSEMAVVARADQLDPLPSLLDVPVSTFVLEPAAVLDDDDSEGENTTAQASELTGLHAKVFVVERARKAHVYIGSANATDQAFDGNVELLCHFEGKVGDAGVDTMLSDAAPFRNLLVQYEPSGVVADNPDADAALAIERYLIKVAACRFRARAHSDGEHWRLRVTSTDSLPPSPFDLGDVALSISPYSSPIEYIALEAGVPVDASFGRRPVEELTGFVIIKARVVLSGRAIERRVVVCAPLTGAPNDRLSMVIAKQVDTPEKFLRLIALLLGLAGGADTAMSAGALGDGTSFAWGDRPGPGLLETLVRGLAVKPDGIDQIGQLIAGIERFGQAGAVLPAGWQELWRAVCDARTMLGSGRTR